MPMIGIGETGRRRRRAARAGAVGARARRRSPDRRAHPLRRARRSSADRGDRLVSDADGRRLRDPGDPRRPGAGPGDRRGRARRSASRRRSRRTRSASTAGYEYARSGNPTRAALETCLASLEGATHGLAFASGLAAEDAVLRTARPRRPRGHPRRRVRRHVPPRVAGARRRGHRVDRGRPHRPRRARRPRGATRRALVWVETPTNPALSIVDIAARRASRARARRARRRRQHVRDAVPAAAARRSAPTSSVHSTTKYLGGHSDVVGGFVAVDDAELADELAFLQNAIGAVPSPFDCYLVLRGRQDARRAHGAALRERAGRRRRCCAEHPAVATRALPGPPRPSRPRGRARARCATSAAWCRFLAAGGEEAALELVARTRLFTLAESLGAVESLIEHPARMTHASAAGSPLEVDPRARPALGRHRVAPTTSSPTSTRRSTRSRTATRPSPERPLTLP